MGGFQHEGEGMTLSMLCAGYMEWFEEDFDGFGECLKLMLGLFGGTQAWVLGWVC